MIKLKNFIAVGIGVVLVLGTVGCGEQEEEVKKVADEQKITYWVSMNSAAASVVDNYGELAYYKALQEKTGVEIEFLHPPKGQDYEQFKVMLASKKDLPDVIEADWINQYLGGPEKAIKNGQIIALNEYLDWAPYYKAAIEVDDKIMREARTDNGSIYGFHSISLNKEGNCFSGLILRRDWLEELNLEAPETIEEWEVVLRAFKEEKGATAPLSIDYENFGTADLFNAAYGITNGLYIDEQGKVQYGPIQPEYKAYLVTLNRWYEEGLLDSDFASIDMKVVEDNILTEKSGATYGFVGSGIGKWSVAVNDEKIQFEGVANPVVNKGDEGKFIAKYEPSTSKSAAITTSAENVESIVKMFDFLYTEEGTLLKNFGIEGITYEMIGGNPVYTDLIMKNPEGLAVANAMGKYIQANYPAPGFVNLPEYLDQYYRLETQKEAYQNFNKFERNAMKYTMPPVTLTDAESKEVISLMPSISHYKDDMTIAFITGAKPLEEFESYVQEIERIGIKRILEIEQMSLERYNSR